MAGGEPMIFHDGGTPGYASALAWEPTRRIGVVALTNQAANVTDIARHLLRPSLPLQAPAKPKPVEIALDPASLDAFTGRYEVVGEGVFAVNREGDFLTIASPPNWGLSKLRLHPDAPRHFFAAELPFYASFEGDDAGRATAMLVQPPRRQQPLSGRRVEK